MAVCNLPATKKELYTSGTTGKLTIIMHIVVADAGAVEVVIQPNLDTVTRDQLLEVTTAAVAEHGADKDRHTSAEEKARIEGELGRKVDFINNISYPSSTIDDFNFLPNGYSRINDYANAMTNAPTTIFQHFNGQVFTNNDGMGLITQTATMGNYIYTRSGTSDHLGWLPWVSCAIAKSPYKLSLPILEGLERVNAAEYWKDEFGLVTITFCLRQTNHLVFPLYEAVICYLPEGFRPINYVAHGAGFQTPSWAHLPIVVEHTGKMYVVVTNNDTYTAMGTISFYAN